MKVTKLPWIAAGGIAWNTSLIVSFYAIALPETPLFISALSAILLILFDFFAPADIPRKQRRLLNMVFVPLIILVLGVSLGLNPLQYPYTIWHMPAVIVLVIELCARTYLILYPDRRLPTVFYPPRRT